MSTNWLTAPNSKLIVFIKQGDINSFYFLQLFRPGEHSEEAGLHSFWARYLAMSRPYLRNFRDKIPSGESQFSVRFKFQNVLRAVFSFFICPSFPVCLMSEVKETSVVNGFNVLMMSLPLYLWRHAAATTWCWEKIPIKIDYENRWTYLKAFGIIGKAKFIQF